MSDDKHVTLVEFTKRAAEPDFKASDAVAELQKRIADGRLNPEKIVMFIIELDADGNWRPQNWKANTTSVESLAILELCRDDIIREIKGTA